MTKRFTCFVLVFAICLLTPVWAVGGKFSRDFLDGISGYGDDCFLFLSNDGRLAVVGGDGSAYGIEDGSSKNTFTYLHPELSISKAYVGGNSIGFMTDEGSVIQKGDNVCRY